MHAVLYGHDAVGVAVPEVHRHLDVREREAPGPREQRHVEADRLHAAAAAEDQVFLEHPAHGRVLEER